MILNALVLSILAGAASARPVQIGAAGAVKGKVEAASAGAAGRVIESGKELFFKDRIKTATEARLQILLLDETVFTVGPHTELTLDEFVYDPNKSVGKISAGITQGVFRFVSGKVAKKDPSAMKVSLPVGTIGIRGTDVSGILRPSGEATIMLKAGVITFTNDQGTVVLDEPGQTLTVFPGKPLGKPKPASKSLLSELASLLGPPRPDASLLTGPVPPPAAPPRAAAGFDQFLEKASQDILAALASGSSSADGASTWAQVKAIAVPANATYSGAGTVNCTGINCGAGAGSNPTANITLEVNFAGRTYGGGTSLLQVAAPLAFAGDSTTILSTSYAAQADGSPAVITLANGVNTASANWDGTTLSFRNVGGTIASQVQVSVTYSNGSDTVNSTTNLTGSR